MVVEKQIGNDYDVVVVGAGISGINAGYRLQTQCPNKSYTILEARDGIGGTWDFFRYPGIRSDSDLHTFGFPWRPWPEQKAIAEGDLIRTYIRESAQEYGIDKKVQFHHKLVGAAWSSITNTWTLNIDNAGEQKVFHANFVIFSTGYYSYDEALSTHIPGLQNFKGQILHPQFWPEDLDYTNKKIVVIGSGATAVTLIPSLAQKAKHVTMLQRSPGYVVARPAIDASGTFMKKYLPRWLAYKLLRLKFLVLPFLFFKFCRAYPALAKRMLIKETVRELPTDVPVDPHFTPSYNPWEQRLCLSPDGDFYEAMRQGKSSVATGIIKTVTEDGITLDNDEHTHLDADIIVTATGLKLQFAGGSSILVDSTPITISSKYLYKGIMLQSLPNAFFVVGYTNASWTLGADATARFITRLLNTMDKKGVTKAVAELEEGEEIKPAQVLNLSSTYIKVAQAQLPMAGDRGVWKARSNYFRDLWEARFGAFGKGLVLSGVPVGQ
jgi:cation diffusion facilitator CzcD-associated flavoprotein CzcO